MAHKPLHQHARLAAARRGRHQKGGPRAETAVSWSGVSLKSAMFAPPFQTRPDLLRLQLMQIAAAVAFRSK
jgi:hypothetical protein